MTTTVEKFVFEAASENGIVEGSFLMPADAKVLYVKITNSFKPAFYSIIDADRPKAFRRFIAVPSRFPLPDNWVHVGSTCNGGLTYHIGEIIIPN